MGICLMAYIEDNLVLRCIIYIMKGNDKFYSTEAGTKMTGVDRTAFDHILTDLIAESLQFIKAHPFYICRRVHLFKNPVCRVFHWLYNFTICEGTKKRYLCKDFGQAKETTIR